MSDSVLEGASPRPPWDDDPIPFLGPIPGPWRSVLGVVDGLGSDFYGTLQASPKWDQFRQAYLLILAVVRDMKSERQADWRDRECRRIAVWLALRYLHLDTREPISEDIVKRNLDLVFDLIKDS